jgi:hypothetical protein
MGGGRVFNLFPGAGGFDWSISRIDAGGLDGSLAVVGTHSPWACLWWCTLVQQRGFGTATKCREGQELVSLLPFVRCHWLCQGQDPCHQSYLGTHHGGHNSCGLLAMVPIFTHGVAVGRAAKLVGYVHQIPGKSLLVPPSSMAVDANIVGTPVDKDDLSFCDSQ